MITADEARLFRVRNHGVVGQFIDSPSGHIRTVQPLSSVTSTEQVPVTAEQVPATTSLFTKVRIMMTNALADTSPSLSLPQSVAVEASIIGQRPVATKTQAETQKTARLVERTKIDQDFKFVAQRLIGYLDFFSNSSPLILERVPRIRDTTLLLLQEKEDALIRLLRQERTLETFEASGRMRLSKLSPYYSLPGVSEEKMRHFEVDQITFLEGNDFYHATLLNEPYTPGEIDFHTHIIKPNESRQLVDHITVADLQAILSSPAWFEPDGNELDPAVRLHCIISIILGPKGWRQPNHGQVVFSLYKVDLKTRSAQLGYPPFGLEKYSKKLTIDF